MLGNLLSVLYLAVFLAAGLLLARRLAPGLPPEGTLVLAAALGLALLAALPALAALALGFTLAAALLALAAAGAVLGGCLWAEARVPRAQKSGGAPLGWPFWLCVLPLLALAVWLLFTHTLYLKGGAYWCGQSTYGDLPMHLAFIQSIAQQGDFPPRYPLLAGEGAYGYPFLCETVSSVFLLLGAGLKFACLLPQCLALLAVFGGGWLLAHALLGGRGAASLAYWLFFMGSGFGFAYFLGGDKGNFTRIFTAFYETPTNYVQENVRWVNPVVDLLIPQRATLMGWALLFPALFLLARFALQEEKHLWKALVLLAAPLPLVHTHSALALVLVCAVLFLRQLVCGPRTKASLGPWLAFAGLAAAAWLPQMLTQVLPATQEGAGFLRWHFNWANEGDGYFWFYIKNIGLVYLLLVPAFLWAGRSLRWMYGGGLLILLVSELVVFQPNNYDNNKLLFVWHLLGCILVANLLVDLARRVSKKSVRVCLAALCIAAATLGSVLTVGREAVSGYEQFSADAIAAARYAKEQTDPHALFLTGTQHVNAIASLAGRSVLCGSPSYVFYHGRNYTAQQAAVQELYETPSAEALACWGVEYVAVSGWEQGAFAVNEAWYRQNCELVFQQGGYSIYRTPG
ncbi:hypothetical protein [Allofournierella sp.]|uniref:hypothetical protein n=1 Tax=Allofournierella sp. TaxID=1940256 RepID=UPI003AB150F8